MAKRRPTAKSSNTTSKGRASWQMFPQTTIKPFENHAGGQFSIVVFKLQSAMLLGPMIDSPPEIKRLVAN